MEDKRGLGAAVLLVSMEMEEILKISDRIAVMYEGRIMGIVRPKETIAEKMGLMMGGNDLAKIS